LVPLFHSGAITPVLGHIVRGISTVTMEAFDPAGALQLIEKYRIRLMQGVTAIMQMILREPDLDTYDLESWDVAILPGSPLPYTLIKEAKDRLGVLCQNLWGLTEMSGPGAMMNIEDILLKPESAGKPFFNVDIKIVDPEGIDVPSGEMGEIVTRGPHMMQGYWKRPEATHDTIKNGWLHTGDMGKIDEDGYLYIVDRVKDMILSGGENIYPAEVEKIIRQIPGVQDASVVGIPDDRWGEVGKAFIEKSSDATIKTEDIIQYCRSKLAGYKVPKQIEYIDALPRNPSGKVLKKDLRRRDV
jgi:fatty-acyl-CoA synthase